MREHMVDDYAPNVLVHPTLGPTYPKGKEDKHVHVSGA
jgi:hypothetical protein